MSEEFPVIVKAFIGYATEEVNGVRRLDVDDEYNHLKLLGVVFGDDFTTSFIEDPDHPGFAKIV